VDGKPLRAKLVSQGGKRTLQEVDLLGWGGTEHRAERSRKASWEMDDREGDNPGFMRRFADSGRILALVPVDTDYGTTKN